VLLVTVATINRGWYLTLFVHTFQEGSLISAVDVVNMLKKTLLLKKHQEAQHFRFACSQGLSRKAGLDFLVTSPSLFDYVCRKVIELTAEAGILCLDVL